MIRVTLFNAALDTGNLGVSALGHSIISGLARRMQDLSLTVADSGFGIRSDVLTVDGRKFPFTRCGVRYSRRLYRSESLSNIRFASRFGGAWNPVARHLMSQDFVLDITGGDSFTDLYGPTMFQRLSQIKALFLDRGIPLGLLPQTYGPFKNPHNRAVATDQIRRARFAWARDKRSYETLCELVGPDFDSERHRCGVDVAFLLEPIAPTTASISSAIMDQLSKPAKATVGVNVSGLIYNNHDEAQKQYGLVADYRKVVMELVRQLIQQSDADILLVPHVLTESGHYESDMTACEDVFKTLKSQAQGRLAVLPALGDPRQVKWVISKCDWFCGTRMHSTIAGLSTGVPTAAIAYSLKTAGVFETCGQGEHVADPRELSTAAMTERLWRSWSLRQMARASLARSLPAVLDQAHRQMDEIVAACQRRSMASASAASDFKD